MTTPRDRTDPLIEALVRRVALRYRAENAKKIEQRVRATVRNSTTRTYRGVALPNSSRTFERIVRDARIEDRDGKWSLGDSENSASARAVLDVLAALVTWSEGQRMYVTKGEARWIAKIQKVASVLLPLDSWWIAVEYLRREAAGQGTQDLDALLALIPSWSDDTGTKQSEETFAFFQSRWPETLITFLYAAGDHRGIAHSPDLPRDSSGSLLTLRYNIGSLFHPPPPPPAPTQPSAEQLAIAAEESARLWRESPWGEEPSTTQDGKER